MHDGSRFVFHSVPVVGEYEKNEVNGAVSFFGTGGAECFESGGWMTFEDSLTIDSGSRIFSLGIEMGGGGSSAVGVKMRVVCKVDEFDEEEYGGESVEVFFHPSGGEDSTNSLSNFVLVFGLDVVGGFGVGVGTGEVLVEACGDVFVSFGVFRGREGVAV